MIDTQEVEEGESATAPSCTETYTKSGIHYTFSKWNKSFAEITADLTVSPVYSKAYEVTFYDYDGKTKLGETQIIEEGEAATAPEISETYVKSGVHYSFTGWDTKFDNVTKVLSIKPEFTTAYEVTFYDYDGKTKLGETQIIEEDKAATAPEIEATGYNADNTLQYTFTDWDTEFDSVTKVLKIKPEFTTKYRVRFLDYNKDQIGENQYIAKGADAEAPEMEDNYKDTEAGCIKVFKGWNASYTGITKAIDLEPEFDTAYEVTFYNYDNTKLGDTQIILKGKNAKAPKIADHYVDKNTAEIKVFEKWDKDFTNVKKNLTVNPVYQLGVSVTFLDGNGEVIETQYIIKGGDAVAPTEGFDYMINISDVYQVFVGWNEDEYTGVEESIEIVPIFRTLNLSDMRGAEEKEVKTNTGTASADGYTLPEYEATDDYNIGWFRSKSGCAVSDTPVTKIVPSIDSDDNSYILTRYNNAVFESYVDGELEETHNIVFFRGTGNNFYFLGDDGEDPAVYKSDPLYGTSLKYCSFDTDQEGKTNLTYDELQDLISSSDKAVKVTKVRCDVIKMETTT